MVKIPPVLVMLIAAGFMYGLANFLPFGQFSFFGQEVLALVLVGLGVLLVFVALLQFMAHKTTVSPTQPKKATALVSAGVYAYSRNPMYLAMLLWLLALGLLLGNAFNTLLAAGFVYYMNHFQIKAEEAALHQTFGKTYTLYCKAVRRWF